MIRQSLRSLWHRADAAGGALAWTMSDHVNRADARRKDETRADARDDAPEGGARTALRRIDPDALERPDPRGAPAGGPRPRDPRAVFARARAGSAGTGR